MFDSLTVILVICLYMALLLLVARWAERQTERGKGLTNNAVVYSLAIAVYCTAWTYYGSVGAAATSRFLFLTIYLGPTLAIFLWWIILRKLVRIKTRHHITSIADLISARYNRSPTLAALVTLIAFLGITPYVALQFRAIDLTFTMISVPSDDASSWVGYVRGPGVVLLLIGFTVALGMRRLDPTERHPGMIMALAVECFVKLIAFLAAGIFVSYFMFDGMGDIFQKLGSTARTASPMASAYQDVSPVTWTSYLLLSMSAIMFLPRQFHVQVVENLNERHIKTAMWVFPLYLFLINIFTFPIAAGGLLEGLPHQQADTFVLGLPLHKGQRMLSLLVFIGGFSAATGMIMVSSIAMSTMLTNHIILPILGWFRRLGFLRRRLLVCRWLAVASFIALGFWSERLAGDSIMLVNIGIMSFAAVLQFAPAIIGGLFWRRGSEAGAILGLSAGFCIWLYTLLLPAMVKSELLPRSIITQGPWGIGSLNPEQLFGVTGLDPVTNAVFWSMLFNIGLYVLGSLWSEQSREEQTRAQEFIGPRDTGPSITESQKREPYIDLENKRKVMVNIFSRYFRRARASNLARQCIAACGLQERDRISIIELAELQSQVEKALAGSIGAAEAYRAAQRSAMFTPEQTRSLTEVYGEILADLNVTPEDLKRKVDFYKERERLLTDYAHELEQEVKERTRELKAANKELESFAYSVSHDLRAPLRSIDGFSQALLEDYEGLLDDTGKDFLARIRRASKRMAEIIDALLKLSRSTRGAMNREKIDLSALAQAVAEDLGSVTPNRKVEFSATPGIVAYGDQRLLRVALENLIGNAWKFTGQRDIARVEFGSLTPASPKNQASESKRIFYVKDNGTGFDIAYAHKLFGAFQRLHGAEEFSGTGVGLATVRRIIHRHGGSVWGEGVEGRGATFYFTL